ncbi:hypothetical protein ACI79C_12935 [Geodermatophilus sp. SYSU D00697]
MVLTPADHEPHRPAPRLGLLHDARLHALPHGPLRAAAGLRVLRLGPAGGLLLGGRRAPHAGAGDAARSLSAALVLFAVDLLAIGVVVETRWALITAVVVAGVFIGVNNTLATQAVMLVSPVERPVASAAHGFVRFLGGGLAPFAAGEVAGEFGGAPAAIDSELQAGAPRARA